MKLFCLLFAAGLAIAQTTRYPGALDSDSSLFVVGDNVQTTLTAAMGTGDSAAVVSNAAGFVPNMVVTICDTSTNTGKCTAWEHMLVTGVSGNVLAVNRAFGGTTARSHSSGRLISGLIDAAHQKVLKDAVVAMQIALGPNLANVGASSGVVTAGAYTFSAYSCSGSSVCVPTGATGMSLIAGNNTLTMTPVPIGVNGSDTGHSLYVSGGTGAAEACAITGGSGTSGQASGSIIINCGNTHSGSWTIQSNSGGLQEAICSLPATGGQVAVTASLVMRANVTNCGKTSVVVTKQAGTTLGADNAFWVLGMAPLTFGGAVAPDAEIFHYGGVTAACADCPGATPRPAAFPITIQGPGASPVYQQTDATVLIGRNSSDSIGLASGLARNTLSVHTDYGGATGTTNGILSVLSLHGNTSGKGSVAVSGYTYPDAATSAIVVGLHGQCDPLGASTATCVAVNAEGSLNAAGANAILIGFESNMNTASPAGSTANVLGAQIQMNNPTNNLTPNSTGLNVQASSGTIPRGVHILDNTGTFTNPLLIETTLSPSIPIALLNRASGTGNVPQSIGFYRGTLAATNLYATIQGNTAPGAFDTGSLTIRTMNLGVLADAVTINSNKSVTIQAGGAASKAVCWGGDGKTLGRCTTAVDATGGCTCAP